MNFEFSWKSWNFQNKKNRILCIIRDIFVKYSENYLKFSILILKNLSFIMRIQNAIAKKNSGISNIFNKTAVQKIEI